MKILIACDSFKDSMSSLDVGITLAEVLKSDHEIDFVSMSDGGEGALESILFRRDYEIADAEVLDPLGREITAKYALARDRQSAFVEMAQTSGLELLKINERDAKKSSSYGLGMLIRHIADKGIKDIAISIGGSATVDCGAGMLRALGVEFEGLDKDLLSNEDLANIRSIDDSKKLYADLNFKVLADVDNVLFGKTGSVYTYARQKGAKENELESMDENIRYFSNLCSSVSKADYSLEKGSGAAGGIAFALKNFYNTEIVSGADFFIGEMDLKNKIKNSDLLISGEGSLDIQSHNSKLISRIAKECEIYSTPLVLICGKVEDNFYDKDIRALKVYELNKLAISTEDSIKNAPQYLRLIAKQILQDLRLF